MLDETMLTTLGQNTTAGPATAPAEPVPVGVPGGAAPGAAGVPGTGVPGPAPAPMGDFMWVFLLLLVVMILTTFLSGRKERKRRAQMLSELKKHDKVVTGGGIIGTVAEIQDDEVVIRVDEGKLRVTKGAIQQVVRAAPAPAGKTDAATA